MFGGFSVCGLNGRKFLVYWLASFLGPIVACVRLRLKTLLQSLSQTNLARDFAKVSVVLNGKNNRSRQVGTAESGQHFIEPWAYRMAVCLTK